MAPKFMSANKAITFGPDIDKAELDLQLRPPDAKFKDERTIAPKVYLSNYHQVGDEFKLSVSYLKA